MRDNDSYVLIFFDEFYWIYEKHTKQFVYRNKNKKQAIVLFNALSSGSGFAGETPAFMIPSEIRSCNETVLGL